MGYQYDRRQGFDRRTALKITPQILDHWRKDLRKMTKIYKSLAEAPEESRLEVFKEAAELFKTFKKNFEAWVYKELLPTTKQDKQNYYEREVAKKVWDALHALDGYRLFPYAWDYREQKDVPNPSKALQVMKTNITRYQRAMSDALKAIELYIESGVERRPAVEHHQIGRVNIVIHNVGREVESDYNEDAIQDELSTLTQAIRKIERAGFPAAVEGLTVHLKFDRSDLRGGQYDRGKDELTLFPLGMGREDNQTLIHEAGHRFYYRKMPSNARAHWESVIDGRASKVTSDDIRYFIDEYVRPVYNQRGNLYYDEIQRAVKAEPDEIRRAKMIFLSKNMIVPADTPDKQQQALLDSYQHGERVNLEFITEYGATNASEAFAEAFMLWVIKGPRALGPWTRDFFVRLTRAGGAFPKYAYRR